jgi:hypothetical protein
MQSLILSDVHFFELECCSSSVSKTDQTDLLRLTRTEPKTNPVPIENGMPTRKNSPLDIPAHIASPSPTTTSVNDRVLFGVFAEFDAFVKHQAVNVMEKTIAPSTNIQNINIGDVNVPWMKDSGRRVGCDEGLALGQLLVTASWAELARHTFDKTALGK